MCLTFGFQSFRSVFHAFPKLQMLHTDAMNDEIFDQELPAECLPTSLRSFVIGSLKRIEVTSFLKALLGGLQSFALLCMSAMNSSLLYHCHNLDRLSFYHDDPVDFLFLRSMPRLKYLADFSECGISAEGAATISREAPNLISLSLLLSSNKSSKVYFEDIGFELCHVKNLILNGDNEVFKRFLPIFLSNHSLFRQVVSLRFLSDTVDSIDLSNQSRPRCTISQLYWRSELDDQLCEVCWIRRNPDWTCSQCKCFVFVLQ